MTRGTQESSMGEPRVGGTRRKARVVALQALYEIDAALRPPEMALDNRLELEPLTPAAQEFAAGLVNGVLENQARIDHLIQEYAPNWPLKQMALVDRNILRVAIYEIMIAGETPPKAAINEAIELAKVFGSTNSPRFVNGVLGSVMKAAQP